MTLEEFFQSVRNATKTSEVAAALETFEATNQGLAWKPVGDKENNQGPINVATDTGRSIIERVTNAVDAILESEHEGHKGNPVCRSPKEAAIAWLGVPDTGLSGLTAVQRRTLAQKVMINVLDGDGAKEARVVEVADKGIGIRPAMMPHTILSLNASNKMQKHYLAGVYGQGGSSTFASSKYTIIASRYGTDTTVGFTIVRFNDLPPEDYKVGNYVYLTQNGEVLRATISVDDFGTGTVARHIGYDLTKYPSPLGPNSLYGLFNEILFDPIIPIFLDNQTLSTRQRRTIVGSRNRLNGAADDDDEHRKGTAVSHNVPMYFSRLGDYGSIGIEYWVLDRPTNDNKKPSAAYVNPAKPIILTHNGQNHAELSAALIRKDSEYPFLTQRLVCHINCDNLTPTAKRYLFASTREDARTGVVYDLIRQELIRVLKSDDELKRLNDEARDLGRQEQDKTAEEQVRKEVAKILKIHGLEIAENIGATQTAAAPEADGRPSKERGPRPKPKEIELHEPPTYIRIIWDEEKEIPFFPEQRRYVRIETDANSNYHDALKPTNSRINIITTGGMVQQCGSTPLKGGRLRGIFECGSNAKVGEVGTIRVELSRPGHPVLSDERLYAVVEKPPVKDPEKQVTVPPFKLRPVKDMDDPLWAQLGWPDNPNDVASSAEMNDGTLEVYYSLIFPGFKARLNRLESRDMTLAQSYSQRYGVWLAVHSLLVYQDQQIKAATTHSEHSEDSAEAENDSEIKERCRMATVSAIFAQREAELAPNPAGSDD